MLLTFLPRSLKKDIIPVINVKTKQKFEEELRQLSNFSGIFQLDIADGKFTAWKNWNVPEDIKRIKGLRQKFEVHLMVQNPEVVVPIWLETKPKRIIVHHEAIKDFSSLLKICQANKVELGLGLNPETPIEVFKDYFRKINFVLMLCVDPGPSGQKFQWYVLDKIKALRKKYPNLNIEVDGGINEEILPEILQSGANYFAIGSAIFTSDKPKEKLMTLRQLITA